MSISYFDLLFIMNLIWKKKKFNLGYLLNLFLKFHRNIIRFAYLKKKKNHF